MRNRPGRAAGGELAGKGARRAAKRTDVRRGPPAPRASVPRGSAEAQDRGRAGARGAPGGPRSGPASGGVPRPPEHRFHAEAAEAAAAPSVVWACGPDGWYQVRDRVPGGPRSGPTSEGVPRPPEHRFHAEAAEAQVLRRILGVSQNVYQCSEEVSQLISTMEQVELAARARYRELGGWRTLVAVGALLAADGRRRRRKKG